MAPTLRHLRPSKRLDDLAEGVPIEQSAVHVFLEDHGRQGLKREREEDSSLPLPFLSILSILLSCLILSKAKGHCTIETRERAALLAQAHHHRRTSVDVGISQKQEARGEKLCVLFHPLCRARRGPRSF